jgi:hypothetical protein
VARTLPPYPQTGDGEADAFRGDRELMFFAQVGLQQPRRPDRGALAEFARVSLDDGVNKRINDAVRGARTPATRRVRES